MMEWCKGKIVTTKDDISTVRIARDAGLPDDTKVVVMVPFRSFRSELNPEWVWQGCVTSGTLVAVKILEQCDLPMLPSPSLESVPPLSMTNMLSIYVSENFCKLHQYKHRDQLWLQPMSTFDVQEVWLSPSPSSVPYVEQFLEQLADKVTSDMLLVKMGGVFRFELQNKEILYFDVVQVAPMCQGQLNIDTNVFVLPSFDNASPHHRSDSDTDSDEAGKTYHVQPGIIEERQHRDDSDDDTESEDDFTSQLHVMPRTRLPSASQLRRSSLVTTGNSGHLLSCVPMNNFPADRNFILLPSATLKKLDCYGLENLLISPVEVMQPYNFQGVSFVAVIEETKDLLHRHSNYIYPLAYLHPELFYNLFPYPMDQSVSDCVIRAEVCCHCYCCGDRITMVIRFTGLE